MIPFKIYYKQHGITRISQFLNPKVFYFKELPRNTALHLLDTSGNSKDVVTSAPYLSEVNGRINVDVVGELASLDGNPRKKHIKIKLFAKPFFTANRRFKFVPEPHLSTDNELSPIMINYNYLDDSYKYVDLPMTPYYKWFNKSKTLWSYVNDVAANSNRNNIIEFKVPSTLPDLETLKLYGEQNKNSMLEIFKDDESLVILDIWRWLVLDSSLSTMSVLDNENLSKINILFTNRSNRSIFINLGYLKSWIKSDVVDENLPKTNQFHPIQIGKFFLKLIMTLQSDVVDENVEENEAAIALDYTQDDLETDKKIDENITDTSSLDTETIIKHVDDDLNFLSKMNKVKQTSLTKATQKDSSSMSDEDVVKDLLTERTTFDGVTEKVVKYGELGVLPAASVKGYIKDIEKFKSMSSPYNPTMSVEEFSSLTVDDLSLNEDDIDMSVSDLVVDKSMHKSSLNTFDKKYINHVLKKDIMRIVSDVQNAGIVIKKYSIDLEPSVLGDKELHTLTLKPIDGASSTIKFRLPVVDSNGFMSINGKTAVLRKQRVDLPIRKIKPNIIGLTSYYGKSFVNRSSKKADDSTEWLVKQINKSYVSEEGSVTSLSPVDVFDNNFKCPYMYAALSSHFREFVVSGYRLMFDHNERFKLGDKTLIEKLESKGSIVTGTDQEGNLLVMDKNSMVHIWTDGTLTELGSIDVMLGVDVTKGPLDISELKVFRKSLPLAIVLGYYMGFSALLKLLGVKYTTTDVLNYRANKQQYILRFQDITYIFDRSDKKSSMILGGLRKFKSTLLHLNVKDFDHPDTYFNILTDMGIGPIYIRELDMLRDMFLDSITKSVLEEMGEPTTFIGLLLRSNEMLLSYQHPDSQDTKYMRVRGYERIAGSIYTELSKSIRSFKNRNIAGKSKVDIGHYEVWNGIVKDNSLKLVENINPIQNLKETEVLTYVGNGGRTAETLNKASRAFHINDLGVVSEATVDSTAVGVNTYLSANPGLSNLRGTIKDGYEFDPASTFSTSMLLSPSADHDDKKQLSL